MANYKKIIVTTNSYNVTDMVSGTTPICDTKVLSGSSWSFTSSELPATVYYETNETPKTKRLLFATDTDHIQDRTGRTTEQINRVFYKQNCKEFTSDGSPITVNNGMDGYVLSGKIEGNTIKNEIFSKRLEGVYTNDNYLKIADDNTTSYVDLANIAPSQDYTIIFFVRNNTKLETESVYLNAGTTSNWFGDMSIKGGQNGIFVFNKTSLTGSRRTAIGHYKCGGLEVGTIVLQGTYLKEQLNHIRAPFYGLSSTQAVISNNGLKYSFYSNLEDKLANRVLDLGGMDGARNSLEIKEDSSAIYTQNTKEGELLGSESISLNTAIDGSYTRFNIDVGDSAIGNVSGLIKIVSSSFKATDTITSLLNTEEAITLSSIQGRIIIKILTSKASTVEQFRNYLAQQKANGTPIIIRYQLATPIVTTIDKSLVPAILTQATNTFTFGGAVAPSKVTIQAPTTDDIAKSYPVTLLNGYIQTVGTATPAIDLLKDGKVRLQMDLIAPSTSMNATIFTIPTELRPITNSRIPVFVNGVSQLATIDKTTGNVNLASVPSASANVYIKTDYRRDI